MEWLDCFATALARAGAGCPLPFGTLAGVLGLIEGLGSRQARGGSALASACEVGQVSLTMNLLVLDGSNPLIKKSMHALLENLGFVLLFRKQSSQSCRCCWTFVGDSPRITGPLMLPTCSSSLAGL